MHSGSFLYLSLLRSAAYNYQRLRNTVYELSALLEYCIALHCIACIALHCMHCIALHCIALHCIALHCIALHCIALHCIVLYCIVLYCVIKVTPSAQGWCEWGTWSQHTSPAISWSSFLFWYIRFAASTIFSSLS